MTNLYNSRSWMEYLDQHFEDCQDYFRFAMVWMSFNSYYALQYRQIRWEKEQVIQFAKDNNQLYEELLNDRFQNILQDFANTKYLDGSGPREIVKDMKPGSNKVVYFRESNKSCEDFFKVVYQIRCNFFHGNKELEITGNLDLVRWAYKYLNIFWKEFLNRASG